MADFRLSKSTFCVLQARNLCNGKNSLLIERN